MMFCPKCGTKALDSATFCQKCGAKLIVGDTTQQADISTPVRQTQNIPLDIPQKKKLGKLPIIIGAVALVSVLIVIVASFGKGDDFLQTQGNVTLSTTNSGTETVSRLHTYMNEEEGISFKYTNLWEEGLISEAGVYFSDDNMTMIMYLLAPTVNGPKMPVMNIRKAPVTQDVINSVFSATLSTLMPEGNMMATEIEDVAISDLPGRKVTFATKADDGADLTIIRYIYFINSYQYRIEFYGSTASMKDIDNLLKSIMDSYTITAANMSSGSGTSPDVISYEGISIGYLLGSTDDVISLLGDSSLNDEFKLRYDDMEFYHDNGTITSLVSSDPSLIEADGITLNKNRDGLIEIFGQSYEEGGEKGSYSMTYNLLDCSLHFELGEPTSEAWRITISPITTTYSISGEILYNGEPIMNLLGKTPDELISIFGVPTSGTTVNGDMYEGGEYYGYQGITFIINHQSGTVDYIMGSPKAMEDNGISLDKGRSDIISALGTPTSEEGIPGDEYYDARYIMTYDMDEYGTILSVEMPDADSKANRITIARYEDGSGDKNYNNTSATVTATDFIGTYSYDASFEDPTGKWNNFYYLLEIGLDGSALVVTQTWRGNYLFDHARVSPSDVTGNTLVFDTSAVGSTEPEIHSLTYTPAKDSPLGTDTIYIDDDDTMPFVRE